MKLNKNKEKKGIVKGFLGKIPLLGDFIRELEKTEPFKKRFEEVDEKIRENLRKGKRKEWEFKASLSARPIIGDVKEETITIKKDYFYRKKDNKLTLAVKVPKKDVDLEVKGRNLFIKSGNTIKKIELPGYFRTIGKKQYEKGFLIVELTK